MKPVIGIIKSSNIIYHLCAEIEYIRALKSCGAEITFVKNLDDALACNGLLFTGGSDITPSFTAKKRTKNAVKQISKETSLKKRFSVFFMRQANRLWESAEVCSL